jgi:RND family efflux transporter MFP subunit
LPLEGSEDAVAVENIAAVRQAKAVFDEAAKNRERARKLLQEGISPQAELDTVETAYIVATHRYQTALEEGRIKVAVLAQRRAELDVAQQLLADTTVRAPFDGAVQARAANTGEYLAAGTPIASLVRLDPLRLRLEVPERESLLVRTGQVVRISVEGSTNVYAGRLARISPAILEQNRMLLVEADVPRRDMLRPGLFVRASIIVDEHDAGLVVPNDALVTFAGIEKVITVEDGKARERVVSTGRRVNGWIEVTGGLRAGAPVVLAPGNLRTGQAVSVSSAEAAPMASSGDSSGE